MERDITPSEALEVRIIRPFLANLALKLVIEEMPVIPCIESRVGETGVVIWPWSMAAAELLSTLDRCCRILLQPMAALRQQREPVWTHIAMMLSRIHSSLKAAQADLLNVVQEHTI